MSALPDVYVGPAYLGWRSWRVMPYEQLGAAETVRLCASGTNGLPKVWEPRQPMRAVCGQFETTHEAPWPDCECGFYAYRTRQHALDHLASFVTKGNGDAAAGWAFGQASLWGRIVEHADGYRAQFAYPYALTVYGSAALAARVRDVYGVDVEIAEEDLPTLDDDEDEEEEEVEEEVSSDPLRLTRLALAAQGRRPVNRLWEALHYPPHGEDRDKYLRDELRVANEERGRPITAWDLAFSIMERRGITNDRPSDGQVQGMAADLWQFAMPRYSDIHRYTPVGGGPRHWLNTDGAYFNVTTDGLEESPPADEHVDRDVLFTTACYEAVGGDEDATFRGADVMAVLTRKLGEPQTSQKWSGAFVGCGLRGWLAGKRPNYQLTRDGAIVGRLGHEPPEWSPCDPGFEETFLQAARAAIADNHGDAVTLEHLEWRFRCKWGGNGHSIGQQFRKLRERGLAEGSRRPGSPLVHWRLVEVHT